LAASAKKMSLLRSCFLVIVWSAGFAAPSILFSQAIKTELRKEGKTIELHRDGLPYYIKGVAGESHYALAKAIGANSIRIRHQDLAPAALDSAQALGMTVLVVLHIPSVEEGFNPKNSNESAALIESFNTVILQHKNHPALLMWSAGFEINELGHGPEIHGFVNNLAKLCHVLDANHPVITSIKGVTKAEIQTLKKSIPEIDAIGINAQGAVEGIADVLKSAGWTKPYLFTEWGVNDLDEAPLTPWEAPVEANSTQKALAYRKRFETVIAQDLKQCLGSYAGHWGYWFKATPTWPGLMLTSGELLGGVDELQLLFTKVPPVNHAPEIVSMKISAAIEFDNVILGTDSEFSAWVQASDPDGDDLQYTWEILPDTFFIAPPKVRPQPLEQLIVNNYGQRISFRTPETKGMFRLYVYIYDRRGKAATANIPFFVN
jgi:hypothetical protein